MPLAGAGTVYPTLRVSDVWGILEVTRGALLASDGRTVTKIYVGAPSDTQARPLKGDGWTLQLKGGWQLAPGARQGDLILHGLE